MSRDLVARLARALLPARIMRDKRHFELWQERGYHVTPVHFYEPVPDTRTLDEKRWEGWSQPAGVDLNEAGQLSLLDELSAYKHEYEAIPRERAEAQRFYLHNQAFETVDAEVYYSLIRRHRPAKILEVGGGNTTLLAAEAALKNEAETGRPCELVCVEPYPRKFLQEGFPGLTRLLPLPAQNIPPAMFAELAAGDILFIDSSHVLAIGSDVQHLFLEALPRVGPGVLVHLHDIFLPAEYPRDWVHGMHRFFNEQYLLQAFLIFNSEFEVVWGSSFMHLTHPDRLAAAFASYDPKTAWPGSFWIRRKVK